MARNGYVQIRNGNSGKAGLPWQQCAPLFRKVRVRLQGGTLFQKDTSYAVTDTLNPRTVTKDFVPVGSALRFRWHAELSSPQLVPVQYKYKLDETSFVPVDSSVTGVDYADGVTGPGLKIFTLKVLDQAGGARQTTRRFGMNLAPDPWWSLGLPPW